MTAAPEPAPLPADVSVARADLLATVLQWHRHPDVFADELHAAARRYATARDLWLDAMVGS